MFKFSGKSLKNLVDYDVDTGVFVWRARSGLDSEAKRFNSRYAGKRAGYIKKQKSGVSYELIRVDGVTYPSHHLASSRIISHGFMCMARCLKA